MSVMGNAKSYSHRTWKFKIKCLPRKNSSNHHLNSRSSCLSILHTHTFSQHAARDSLEKLSSISELAFTYVVSGSSTMYILLQVAAILDVPAVSISLEHNAASGSTAFLVTSSPQLERALGNVQHSQFACIYSDAASRTYYGCIMQETYFQLSFLQCTGTNASEQAQGLLTRRIVEKLRGQSVTSY
ncbi:hypothetical protein EDD22DRAFT_1054894, partial [Suillus occidentalis]